MSNFEAWLNALPIWLQDARRMYGEREQLTDDDVQTLVLRCKEEAEHGASVRSDESRPASVEPAERRILRLSAVSQVRGINRLAPSKPLDFGEENLVIIYGANGSGKSGYARILKHVCSARKTEELLPNVFDAKRTVSQECLISYSVDACQKDELWKPELGAISELTTIDIFDGSVGGVYITDECSVTYQPPQLRLIEALSSACRQVQRVIDREMTALVSTKPPLQATFSSTEWGKWYSQLTSTVSSSDIEQRCSWTAEDQAEYDDIQRRLRESDPLDHAKELRKQKHHLETLVSELKNAATRLADERMGELASLTEAVHVSEVASKVAAASTFEGAELSGVGEEVWKQLWLHARQYSKQVAYPDQDFPNISDGALCVLCHQPLGEAAKSRLQSFEQFVSNTLEQQAKKARVDLLKQLAELPFIPSEAEVSSELDLGRVTEESSRSACITAYAALGKRRDLAAAGCFACEPLPETKDLVQRLSELAAERDTQATQLELEAQPGIRESTQKRQLELAARRWVTENRGAIENEVVRLNMRERLAGARRLTDTTGLSRKASQLAEPLISQSFAQRFLEEVRFLGGRRIPAEITRTGTTSGQVRHRVTLVGTPSRPAAILSDGERRLVSLSAFLADVLGKGYPTPSMFDDPVSSLDQEHEEAVASRLTRLATDRQVIIFTHRLSFVALLEDAASKLAVKPRIVHLRSETWGTGEPYYEFKKNLRAAVSDMLGKRVKQAEQILNDSGRNAYDVYAKAICSEIRILLERVVEEELLNGVVLRFRRSVMTMNKLARLSSITHDDCRFVDDMMTKYSRFEHSQSDELSVLLPDPEELVEDLKRLQGWLTSWKKRGQS